MRLFKAIICSALFFFCADIYGQISHGGWPLPEDLGVSARLRNGGECETVYMPHVDFDSLRSVDTSSSVRCGAERFAYSFKVDYTPENSGVVRLLEDGTSVWRLHIVSEGAYSLNLIFDEYSLDEGSKLFLYTPDRSVVRGSFTFENNSPSGVLATAPLPGDEVVVELVRPKGSASRLRIGSVNHDYQDLKSFTKVTNSAFCQVDATCYGEHELQMRSSVLYIVEGTEYCSGNMINNTANDGTPYMITSSHCLYARGTTDVVFDKAAKSVFFFNFQRPHCHTDIYGSMEKSLAGSEIVFLKREADALLLRLNNRPPLEYSVYYAGWNATRDVPSPYYSFHHPNKDMLKISVEEDEVFLESFVFDDIFAPDKHWIVDQWEVGIMEGGSSGAALFDAKDRIVGSLSGGATNESCSLPGYDAFWALSESWTDGLDKLLDPNGKGVYKCDGMESDASPCSRLTNWEQNELPYLNDPHGEYAAGNNSYGFDEYAEHFRVKESHSALYGVHFVPYVGTYSEEHPILLRVYSGDSLPDKLLSEDVIRMGILGYSKSIGGLEKDDLIEWSLKDNYYKLRTPVVVDTSFFISMKMDMDADNEFALCVTKDKYDGKNTAYFKSDDGSWHPFEGAHPFYNMPTSLYIEPIVRLGISEVSLVDQQKDCRESVVFPNPVESVLNVLISPQEKFLSYELTGLDGRSVETRLLSESSDGFSIGLDSASGAYILRIIYDSKVESFVILKK